MPTSCACIGSSAVVSVSSEISGAASIALEPVIQLGFGQHGLVVRRVTVAHTSPIHALAAVPGGAETLLRAGLHPLPRQFAQPGLELQALDTTRPVSLVSCGCSARSCKLIGQSTRRILIVSSSRDLRQPVAAPCANFRRPRRRFRWHARSTSSSVPYCVSHFTAVFGPDLCRRPECCRSLSPTSAR